MKKKKILLIICTFFLLTGCSATYELEIYDDQFKESVTSTYTDSNTWDIKTDLGFSKREKVMTYLKYPLLSFKYESVGDDDGTRLEGHEYYDTKLVSNDNELGLNWQYTFNPKNYSDSTLASSAYKYFTFMTSSKNTWILSTDSKVKSFYEYSELENITIKVKTNHKVISNNADKIDGLTYIWNISRDQKDSKTVQIELSKDEKILNYEDEIVKKVFLIGGVVLAIAILGISVIIFFKWKNKRSNKI